MSPAKRNADPQIRKTISLPLSLWQQIEDWRFGERHRYDSVACRLLLQKGLQAVRGERGPKGARGPAGARGPRGHPAAKVKALRPAAV